MITFYPDEPIYPLRISSISGNNYGGIDVYFIGPTVVEDKNDILDYWRSEELYPIERYDLEDQLKVDIPSSCDYVSLLIYRGRMDRLDEDAIFISRSSHTIYHPKYPTPYPSYPYLYPPYCPYPTPYPRYYSYPTPYQYPISININPYPIININLNLPFYRGGIFGNYGNFGFDYGWGNYGYNYGSPGFDYYNFGYNYPNYKYDFSYW